VAKRKQSADTIKEMKNITARYFVTCYSSPDTFDLPNDEQIVDDKADQGFGGQQDMEEMM
jgi:hypothetical protein